MLLDEFGTIMMGVACQFASAFAWAWSCEADGMEGTEEIAEVPLLDTVELPLDVEEVSELRDRFLVAVAALAKRDTLPFEASADLVSKCLKTSSLKFIEITLHKILDRVLHDISRLIALSIASASS